MREMSKLTRDYNFEYGTVERWACGSGKRSLSLSISLPVFNWYWLRKLNAVKRKLGMSTKSVLRRLDITLDVISIFPEDPLAELQDQGHSFPIEIDTWEVDESHSPRRLTMEMEGRVVRIDYVDASVECSIIDDSKAFDQKYVLVRPR